MAKPTKAQVSTRSRQKGDPNKPKRSLRYQGIKRDDPAYQPLFKDLQGNILKGHGRNYVRLIFLQFKHDSEQDREKVKEWIKKVIAPRLTSAQKQFEHIKEHKTRPTGKLNLSAPAAKRDPGFMMFLLTAKGYQEALGITPPKPEPFNFDPRRPKTRQAQNPDPFINGMQASQGNLDDPTVDQWEPRYAGRGENTGPIHALILCANDRLEALDQEEAALRRSFDQDIAWDQVIAWSFVERGAALVKNDKDQIVEAGSDPRKKSKRQVVEHFGYADGISQPLFLYEDMEKEARRCGGINNWNPSASLDLVLVKDPYGFYKDRLGEDKYGAGSFMVFRKLQQDVGQFRKHMTDLANKLGLKGKDRQRAGAMVIGRFENGTPLAEKSRAVDKQKQSNNFNYINDPGGTKCPLHAHIRKVNIRFKSKKKQDTEEFRDHRIVRRGMTYGTRAGEEVPQEEVGLLFMCFQSDISKQFELIQSGWANVSNFPNRNKNGDYPGIDPLIGQDRGNVTNQHWPVKWGEDKLDPSVFRDCVTLKGGEYFFAPSVSFLRNLT